MVTFRPFGNGHIWSAPSPIWDDQETVIWFSYTLPKQFVGGRLLYYLACRRICPLYVIDPALMQAECLAELDHAMIKCV